MNLDKNVNPSVYEFQDSIEQLYVEENGQGDIVATAVNKENITSIYIDNSKEPPKARIIPTNTVQSLSDFINITNGRLPPNIASSTTVSTITTSTERANAELTTISTTEPAIEISTEKETTAPTKTTTSTKTTGIFTTEETSRITETTTDQLKQLLYTNL